MISAGELKVGARYADGALQALTVDLQRPSVTPLFVGQLPDVVIKTVPYLFTLCAAAQRSAAQAAVNAALGEAPAALGSRELWVEFLHESLWRLLLDWPVAVGLAPAREAFSDWRGRRNNDDAAAVTLALIDAVLQPLADTCMQRLPADATLPANVGALPALAAEAWLAYWEGTADRLPATPPPSSVGLAYRQRVEMVRRAATALVEKTPYPLARAGGDGWGVGQCLTARGMLTHAVHVVDGRVARYCVRAPTDQLFADSLALRGVLAGRGFATLADAQEALDQAILALDPCLPYTLEVQYA